MHTHTRAQLVTHPLHACDVVQVTELVRNHGDTTLAIGDGANDVGMIQKAHIGASCRAAGRH